MAAKWILNQEKGNFNMLLTFKEISVTTLAELMLRKREYYGHIWQKNATFAKRVRKVTEQKDDCSLQLSKSANSRERGESHF